MRTDPNAFSNDLVFLQSPVHASQKLRAEALTVFNSNPFLAARPTAA